MSHEFKANPIDCLLISTALHGNMHQFRDGLYVANQVKFDHDRNIV